MRRGVEDHPGLDELTDDIAEERGELDDFARDPSDAAGGEFNFLRESDRAAQVAPSGEPVADSIVRSVWDTRPLDTRDFLVVLTAVEPAAPGTTSLDFQVPEGLTGFLRSFRFELDPVDATRSRFDFLWSLILDGVPVPDYFELPLGQFQETFLPTFVIGASFQRLGIRLRISGPALAPGVDLFAELYGQFKLNDGRPAKMQVGNIPAGPPQYARQPVLAPEAQAALEARRPPALSPSRYRPRRPPRG